MSFLVVEMIFVNRGFAAIHSVTATGSYEIGEEDSISIAKQKALDEAKRNAAEQVGIYVESETVVEDNKITKDTITLMTAQFIHIQGRPIWKRVAIGDFGTRLIVTIQAYIDDDDLNTIRKRIDDKTIFKKYEELQSNYDELQRDNRELKSQLETMKKEKDRKKITNKLSSNEEVYKANNYMMQLSEIIQFNNKDYDSPSVDHINHGRELLNKIHNLLDKNLSIPAAIPLYLDLGINELTLETNQFIKTTNSFISDFEMTDNQNRKNQLHNEFMVCRKNQAQRYYDISAYYINFAESLPDTPDYIYKKYCALETYYGYKAIALKMRGDDSESSKAVEHAEYCLSLIPKSSEYYQPCFDNIQAIKGTIRAMHAQ